MNNSSYAESLKTLLLVRKSAVHSFARRKNPSTSSLVQRNSANELTQTSPSTNGVHPWLRGQFARYRNNSNVVTVLKS